MLKLIDGILVGNGFSFSLRLIFELLYPRGGMFITYLHHFINDTDRQWSISARWKSIISSARVRRIAMKRMTVWNPVYEVVIVGSVGYLVWNMD